MMIMISNHAQSTPELILPGHEYSYCESDSFFVFQFTITGTPEFYIGLVRHGNDEDIIANFGNLSISVTQTDTLRFKWYFDANSDTIFVDEQVVITEYPDPQLRFSGGGYSCVGGNIVPLVANFSGEPGFELACLINNVADTIRTDSLYHEFDTTGSFQIITQSFGDNLCTRSLKDTLFFELVDLPEPPIYGDTNVCQLGTKEYYTHTTDYFTDWYVPNIDSVTEIVGEDYPAVFVSWEESGLYHVRLRLIDQISGCTTPWSVLDVLVNPVARIEKLIDTTVCFEQVGFLELDLSQQAGDEVYWPELEDNSIPVRLYNTGNYTYVYTNNFNCSDTGVVVLDNNCNPDVHVPEAFTPNDDGVNDVLPVFGLFSSLNFSIYSSRGILLYHTTDRESTWDGRYEGRDLPQGSYYWHAEFEAHDGKLYTKSGVVNIIK